MKIEHRPGKKHSNADGVSRIPCRQCGLCDAEITEKPAKDVAGIQHISQTESDLKTLQQQDKDLSSVISWLQTNTKPKFKDVTSESYCLKALWNQFDFLAIEEGLLVQNWKADSTGQMVDQAVVPIKHRRKMLVHAHDIKSSGHLGIKKCLAKIRQKYYWPGLHNAVRIYFAGCETCMKRKGPVKSLRDKMAAEKNAIVVRVAA